MENIKTLNVRLPKKLWRSIKKEAFDQEISLNKLIIRYLEKKEENNKKDVDSH